MNTPTKSWRDRPGTSIAIAALVTLAFLAAVALAFSFGGSTTSAASSTVEGLSPLRLMSGFVVIGVPALTAWSISVNHRCLNNTIRRILACVSIVMVAWLCIACVMTTLFDIVNPPLVAIAVVSDFVVAVFIEAYIESRLFPSIQHYRAIFRRLPLDIKILNASGRIIYETDAARTLDSTTLVRVAKQTIASDPKSTLVLYSDSLPDIVFKPFRLHAGITLVTEDAREINRLQHKLEERQAQLTSQNEVLRRNNAMQSLVYRQQRERELGEQVERDLASTAAQIRTILDNRIPDDGPDTHAERLQQLNLVKVLVAYSKRKGMLALASAESETLTSEQLHIITREAMADLRSIGIECAMLVESDEPIRIAAFNTVYDCFYDCILGVLPHTSPVMMTYISTRDGGTLEMRTSIECAMGLTEENAIELIPSVATSTDRWTAMQMDIAQDLEDRLDARGGDFTVSLDDGLVNATIRVAPPDEPPLTPLDAQHGDPANPIQTEGGTPC